MKKSVLAAAIVLAGVPAFAEIDPIVIEYSSREMLSKSPTRGYVQLFSAKDLRNSQAKTIGEFLAHNAAVVAYDNQGSGFKPTIGLRGFGATASQNTLFLVNGSPINPSTLEGPAISAISLKDVSQIEVRPGSESAEYGSAATAGVISITTVPEAADTVRVEGGSFGFGRVSVSKAQSDQDSTLSVSASKQTFDGYRDNTDFESETASLKFHRDTASLYQNVFVSLDKAEQNTRSGSTLDMLAANRKGGLTTDSVNSKNLIATLSDERSWRYGQLITSAAFTRSNRDGTVNFSTLFDQQTDGYRLNFENLSSSSFKLGAELRYDDYEYFSPNVSWGTKRSNSTQRQLGAYSTVTVFANEQSTATASLRWAQVKDKVEKTHTSDPVVTVNKSQSAVAWSLAARRQLSESWVVRGSLDQAFRFATVDEQQASQALPNALKPQRSRSFHIGLSGELGQSSIDVEMFRMNIKDEIGYQNLPGWSNDGNFNIDNTSRTGAIVSYGRALNQNNDLRVALNLLDAEVTGGAQKGNKLPLVSEQVVTLALNTQLGKETDSRLTARFESDRVLGSDWDNEGSLISDQVTVDWHIARRISTLDLSLGITNLFDAENYSYGVRGFTSRLSPSGTYNFYVPALPRSLTVSATTRF